jgi:MFS family permease
VLSLLALCSLLGEGAADGWSAVYLRDNLGTSAGFAAMGYAAFALTMASGRLAGDRLADRFGPVVLLRAGGVLAAVGMITVLVTAAPAGALAGFAVYGAGLSCTFPQMLALAGGIRPDRPGSAIGRVAGTGYAGLLAGPVLIGGLATVAGLTAALGLPALLTLGIAAGAGYGVPRHAVPGAAGAASDQAGG